jgi:hypothetical protein
MRRKTVPIAAPAAATTTTSTTTNESNSTATGHKPSVMMMQRRRRRRVVESSNRQPQSLYRFVRLRCYHLIECLCLEGRVGNVLFYACGLLLTGWMVLVLLLHNRLLSKENEKSIFSFFSSTTKTTIPHPQEQQLLMNPKVSSFQRWRSQRRRERESNSIDYSFQILFPNFLVAEASSSPSLRLSSSTTTTIQAIPTSIFHHPIPLGAEEQAEGDLADYGMLVSLSGGTLEGDVANGNMRFFDEEGGRRYIYKDPTMWENHFREPFLLQDYGQDGYYAFDDDYIRSTYGTIAHTPLHDKRCRRTTDHRLNHQTCNTFHETPFLECQVKPLGYVIHFTTTNILE